MATGRGKRLVYVSEDLIEKASKVSRDEGVTLPKLVENALMQTVKVNELGYNSKQMADFFNVLQTHRVLGGLFIPSGVLDFMINTCCKKDDQQLEELWYESGKWNGKYLREKFLDHIDAFRQFLELSRWDLNEVEVKNTRNAIKVRCVSTVMTTEGTKLLAKFIEGIMNGMNYKTGKADILKGMIILEFEG